MTIILLAAVVLPIVLSVYNIKCNEGKARKRIIIATAGFVLIFGIALAAMIIEEFISEYEKREYTLRSGGLFNSVTYQYDENGYHVFHESQFLGGGDYIAVPDTAELPPFVSIWNEVTLVSTNNTVSGAVGIIIIGDKPCDLMPESTKIRGCYFVLDIFIMAFDMVGFAIYEIIRAIVTFVRSWQK